MKPSQGNVARQTRFAKSLYGDLPESAIEALKELLERQFSVLNGDLKYLESGWYVTHSGLLRLAKRRHCVGIHARLVPESSDPANSRWIFAAIVFKSRACKGFVGYGDADPSNVSPLVRGAEMRVAETRAVNRALRKAYGIGICSIEEIGWLTGSSKPNEEHPVPVEPRHQNGSNNGQPKRRDRLCVLIRRHNLDPTLVKAYAADYCGTSTLK